MLVCVSFAQLCTRDRGCSAHPAFSAPSVFEGQRNAKLGQHRAARLRTHIRCLKFESEMEFVVKDERAPLSNTPPPHAPLRVAGRGRRVGGASANSLPEEQTDRPPTPNPSPPLRGWRGDQLSLARMWAHIRCLKCESEKQLRRLGQARKVSFDLARALLTSTTVGAPDRRRRGRKLICFCRTSVRPNSAQ
jgi:hypothetical protein